MNFKAQLGFIFFSLVFSFTTSSFSQTFDAEKYSKDISQIQLYKDSDSYYKKIQLAQNAHKRIWMSTMIFDCSDSSMVFWNELARKQKEENVDVRIMGEGLYLGTVVSNCKNILKNLDLKVTSVFDHLGKGSSLTRMQHQKYMIFDDEEVILGGQNFIKYTNLSNDNNLYVRDTDVYIKSNRISQEVQNEFVWMWNEFTKADKINDESYEGIEAIKSNKASCRIVSQNPRRGLDQADEFLREQISKAHTAHFISPDVQWTESSRTFQLLKKRINTNTTSEHQMRNADFLKQRINQGLQFVLIRPGYAKTPDEGSMFFRDSANILLERKDYLGAGLSGLGDLLYKRLSRGSDAKTLQGLKEGLSEKIHVFEYKKYTHTKAYIFDNKIAMLGSINFEHHSLDGNYEMGFVCDDPRFVNQMIEMFEQDKFNSQKVL